MARPIRIEYAGAVYHVMAPVNNEQHIFRDDKDCQRWIAEMLAMGHHTRVSRMNRKLGNKLEQLKKRLLKTEKSA